MQIYIYIYLESNLLIYFILGDITNTLESNDNENIHTYAIVLQKFTFWNV